MFSRPCPTQHLFVTFVSWKNLLFICCDYHSFRAEYTICITLECNNLSARGVELLAGVQAKVCNQTRHPR